MQARALGEAQVEAERIADATRAALAADGDLIDAGERAEIDAALADLAAKRAGDDHLALRAAVENVNRVTGEFAGRRMDRGVARALTGKRIDALSQ